MTANTRKNLWTAVAVLVALLIILAIIRRAIKKARNRKGTQAQVNEDDLDPSVNYDGLALQMKNVLFGLFDAAEEKNRVLYLWLELTDNEFKHVCNLYNRRYASGSDTVRNHILDEWYIGVIPRNKFLSRMDRLGLA